MRVPANVAGACHPLDAPPPRQDSSDLTTLFAQARAVKDELRAISTVIAAAGQGRVIDECALKDEESAKRKIAGKYRGDTARICDLVRNRIVFPSEAALYAGAAAALERYPGIFVQIHNRLVEPKANGYVDFSMSPRLSNGHIGELQLHLDQMLAAADVEHALYENVRLLQAGALANHPSVVATYEARSAAIYRIAATAVRERRPLSDDERLRMHAVVGHGHATASAKRAPSSAVT